MIYVTKDGERMAVTSDDGLGSGLPRDIWCMIPPEELFFDIAKTTM